MKPKNLRNWLCLMVGVLSACGQNVQDNEPTTYTSTTSNPWQARQNVETSSEKMAKTYLQLGIEYMRAGQNNVALKELKKALNVDNNYADAHNAIAVLYERLGAYDQAKKHYQIAEKLKPNDSDIHNNYGQFLCKHKQWPEAEKHFLKAVENPLYQTPEIPYTNLGLCALQYKDTAKAETFFHKALQKNPKFPRTLFQMAQLTYEQGRYQQARDYLQRYLEIAKHVPQTLWLGIHIERALNNREMEARYTLSLRRDFPNSKEAKLLNQSP